jgi:hypothetical protein
MNRILHWAVISLALIASTAPAAAQSSRPGRPYRGLFGSGAADAGQRLAVSASVATGYDDNLRADAIGQNSGLFTGQSTRHGTLAHLAGTLTYAYEMKRVSIRTSAATAGRYYPSSDSLVQSTGARLSMSVALREPTSLTVGASAVHQPYSFLSTFTAQPEDEFDTPALDLDLAETSTSYLAYTGTVGLSHRLSRRTSLAANYAVAQADRLGSGQLKQQHVRTVLTHNIAQGIALRGGYRYGEIAYPGQPQLQHHTIDAGVDYNRTLSISRRTTLSFGTGSSAITVNDRLRFMAVGDAALNHEIGRSWNARASYGRHVRFDEAWAEPVLTDSINGLLGGLLSRRLNVSLTARAARGDVGLRGTERPVSYHAGARFQYALTRFMNCGLTYSYYHHRLDETALVPDVLRAADRQSIRAVVNMWAPLFQRIRRADATR